MRIIDKTAAQVRSLTPAEEELLVGFATGALAGPRLLQANQWLMKVRSANQWLACDCRRDALPVLNITLNGSTGTLFLRNNPDTPSTLRAARSRRSSAKPVSALSRPHNLPRGWRPILHCVCWATSTLPAKVAQPAPEPLRNVANSSVCSRCC